SEARPPFPSSLLDGSASSSAPHACHSRQRWHNGETLNQFCVRRVASRSLGLHQPRPCFGKHSFSDRGIDAGPPTDGKPWPNSYETLVLARRLDGKSAPTFLRGYRR